MSPPNTAADHAPHHHNRQPPLPQQHQKLPNPSQPLQPLQPSSTPPLPTPPEQQQLERPEAPVRARAREQLRECHALIRQLIDAHWQLPTRFAKPPDAPPPPPKQPAPRSAADSEQPPPPNKDKEKLTPVVIMEKLIRQQGVLRATVDQLHEHQQLHALIDELRRANAVEDAKIARLGTNLRAAESVLQNALDDAKPRLAALKRANKRPVDVDDVISYGSKISASLSAPPNWQDNEPLGNHLPPAPAEGMMRAGRLAALEFDLLNKPPTA